MNARGPEVDADDLNFEEDVAPAQAAERAAPAHGRTISMVRDRVVIAFPFDPKLVRAVKTRIPERDHDMATGNWHVQLREDTAVPLLKFASDYGFHMPPGVEAAIRAAIQEAGFRLAASQALEGDISIPTLNGTLRPYQAAGVSYLLRVQRSFLADEMGLGKRLAVGTPVLTATGWAAIESINVGDHVVGSDGSTYPVTATYFHPDRPLYRITFNDGASITADDEHLWQVQHIRNDTRHGRWRTMTTDELLKFGLKDGAGNRNWRIPLVSPVERPDKDLPTDPYMAGVVLGDGCHLSTDLWKVCTDEVILDWIGATRRKPHESSCIGYGNVRAPGIHPARSAQKSVPKEYLLGSVVQRMALLRGLMDTDGHPMPDGGAEFSSTSTALVDAVTELAESLGGLARRRPTEATHYTLPNGKRIPGQPSTRVNIKLPPGINPFRLPRKATAYRGPTKYPPTRTIAKIERVANGPGVCLSVDSPDHLFVAQHHIVTHNTLQTLAMCEAADAWPLVVISKRVGKLVWAREALKFLPHRSVTILDSRHTNTDCDIVILNWDILSRRGGTPKEVLVHRLLGNDHFVPGCIAADESHFAKNPDAKRTRALMKVGVGVKYRLAISGTPLLNKPEELIPQLQFLDRLEDLGGDFSFRRRFCGAYTSGTAMSNTAAADVDTLRGELRKVCFLRREKRDVWSELPEKQRTVVPMPLDDPGAYKKAEGDVIAWMAEQKIEDVDFQLSIAHLPEREREAAISQKFHEHIRRSLRGKAFAQINGLRQLAARHKLKSMIEWIRDFLEAEEKLIVFAHHQAVQSEVAKAFPGCLSIVGNMKDSDRGAVEHAFQNTPAAGNGHANLIVCSMMAAGDSITLDAASNVAFCELPWTPAAIDQCEDRCYGRGVDPHGANVWFLLNEDTIDGDMWELIEDKRGTTEAVTRSIEQELIDRLIAKAEARMREV